MPRPRPHNDHLCEQLLGTVTGAITRTGIKDFSLCTLATDAGTSTSTIYQLSGSQAALLNAVYLRVLEEFSHAQSEAPMCDDPLEDLLELAHAYRCWTLENRNQLLVLVEWIAPGQEVVTGVVGHAIPVEGRVRGAMNKGALLGPLEQVMLSLWVTVHGYTALEVAGVATGSDNDFEAITRTTQHGWPPDAGKQTQSQRMCNTATSYEPPSVPPGQVFEIYPEFLATITPGMRLCTSDLIGWGEVTGTTGRSVLGIRDSDGAGMEVPQEALLDVRGGHCVRLGRARTTIDRQG